MTWSLPVTLQPALAQWKPLGGEAAFFFPIFGAIPLWEGWEGECRLRAGGTQNGNLERVERVNP